MLVFTKECIDKDIESMCASVGPWYAEGQRVSPDIVERNGPRFMIGSLRVPEPFTKQGANGSSRYPSDTALRRETAASVSVD